MAHFNNSKRIRPDQLQVDSTAHPDWESGATLSPVPGDRVFCAAGLAQVSRLAGKASDGSRILELKLVDIVAPPFFASSANVLVAPRAIA
jgi:hypothetical protein